MQTNPIRPQVEIGAVTPLIFCQIPFLIFLTLPHHLSLDPMSLNILTHRIFDLGGTWMEAKPGFGPGPLSTASAAILWT